MKRKTIVALPAESAAPLPRQANNKVQQEKLTNWAGNMVFSARNIYYPRSLKEVQELVKKASRLRALGTRHSFNTIADSTDTLLSLRDMNKVVSLDTGSHTVTVEGGISYGELSLYLHEKGFALHNLASLPHISVAGSIATATHGSGIANGNLATAVKALEIVAADGNIVSLSLEKDGNTFLAAVVGLGAFGVVTKVGLGIQPAFMMRQQVYEKLSMVQLEAHFEQIISAGYSVSLFTDWKTDCINQVWIKSRVDDTTNYSAAPSFFGASAAIKDMHPIDSLPAENCTEQMGVAGPWHERLPHFKMGFTPSSGNELQSEFFIPRHNAMEAILAVARLGNLINPHLLISEIRTVASDNLWMSPCRGQETVAIHFTWKQEWPEVHKLLALVEKELEPFGARPHWGKLFTISPNLLATRYEKMEDFKKLVATYDPRGKFRNDFLNSTMYGTRNKV